MAYNSIKHGWHVGHREMSERDSGIAEAIEECRSGVVSAFALLKSFTKKNLFENFGVTEQEYEAWEEKYNQGSELIG